MKFSGQLKFPDIDHPGIPVVILVEDIHVQLDVDAEAVGRWSLVDVEATRLVASAFQLNLDGEEVTFIADEPLDFAYQGVEHMAETWARIQSLSLPRRAVSVRKSRRNTMPSRLFELRDAVLETLEEPTTPMPKIGSPQAAAIVMTEPEGRDVEIDEPEEQPSVLLPGPGLVASLAERIAEGLPPVEEPVLADVETTDAVDEKDAVEAIEPPQVEDEESVAEAAQPGVGGDEGAGTEEEAVAAEDDTAVAEVEETAADLREPIRPRPPEAAWFEDKQVDEPADGPIDWPEPAPMLEEVAELAAIVPESEADREEPSAEVEQPAAEVEELELPEETKQLLGTPAGDEAGLFVDLGRYEDGSGVKEAGDDEGGEDAPEPESDPALGPTEPVLVGVEEKSGLLGAVRSAFSRNRVPHEHEFVDAPGGMGLTRQICADCGHISIRSDD